MKISEMITKCQLESITGEMGMDTDVSGAYVGDLLSWVMGNAKSGDAWVTIQGHLNIVAVAALTGAACIIVAEGAAVDEATVSKAVKEEIPILVSKKSAYDVCKTLMAVGIGV